MLRTIKRKEKLVFAFSRAFFSISTRKKEKTKKRCPTDVNRALLYGYLSLAAVLSQPYHGWSFHPPLRLLPRSYRFLVLLLVDPVPFSTIGRQHATISILSYQRPTHIPISLYPQAHHLVPYCTVYQLYTINSIQYILYIYICSGVQTTTWSHNHQHIIRYPFVVLVVVYCCSLYVSIPTDVPYPRGKCCRCTVWKTAARHAFFWKPRFHRGQSIPFSPMIRLFLSTRR